MGLSDGDLFDAQISNNTFQGLCHGEEESGVPLLQRTVLLWLHDLDTCD